MLKEGHLSSQLPSVLREGHPSLQLPRVLHEVPQSPQLAKDTGILYAMFFTAVRPQTPLSRQDAFMPGHWPKASKPIKMAPSEARSPLWHSQPRLLPAAC